MKVKQTGLRGMRKAGKAKVYTASAVLYVHRPKPKKKREESKTENSN
jgi:hypothetical protein